MDSFKHQTQTFFKIWGRKFHCVFEKSNSNVYPWRRIFALRIYPGIWRDWDLMFQRSGLNADLFSAIMLNQWNLLSGLSASIGGGFQCLQETILLSIFAYAMQIFIFYLKLCGNKLEYIFWRQVSHVNNGLTLRTWKLLCGTCWVGNNFTLNCFSSKLDELSPKTLE